MRIEKIRKRTVMFTFKPSPEWDLNLCLIMGRGHNFIIDTGLGSSSVAYVLDYIKDDDKPIIVINTHHHWDHIWGNSSLADCSILSHRLCPELIESKWDAMLERHSRYLDGLCEKRLPNMLIEDSFYFPEDRIRVFHTPGHTPDSISILDEEEGVLNAGDNIGDNMIEIVPGLDCSQEVYLKTLLKYREYDFDTVVSGHNACVGRSIIADIEAKLG